MRVAALRASTAPCPARGCSAQASSARARSNGAGRPAKASAAEPSRGPGSFARSSLALFTITVALIHVLLGACTSPAKFSSSVLARPSQRRATQRLQVVALPPEYAGVPFTGLAGIVSYRLEMATCFFVLSLGEGPNCERGARPIGDDGVASGGAVVERLGAERVRTLKAPDTRFRPGEKGRGRHPLGRLPQIMTDLGHVGQQRVGFAPSPGAPEQIGKEDVCEPSTQPEGQRSGDQAAKQALRPLVLLCGDVNNSEEVDKRIGMPGREVNDGIDEGTRRL